LSDHTAVCFSSLLLMHSWITCIYIAFTLFVFTLHASHLLGQSLIDLPLLCLI
jgi:hypothetical protein